MIVIQSEYLQVLNGYNKSIYKYIIKFVKDNNLFGFEIYMKNLYLNNISVHIPTNIMCTILEIISNYNNTYYLEILMNKYSDASKIAIRDFKLNSNNAYSYEFIEFLCKNYSLDIRSRDLINSAVISFLYKK